MNSRRERPIEWPADPGEIFDRKDWSDAKKRACLKDWQLDLMERMTATEENMLPPRDDGRLADLLSRVTHALEKLESREADL